MLIGSGTDQIALRAEVDRICRKIAACYSCYWLLDQICLEH
jgi:hypothetical protein